MAREFIMPGQIVSGTGALTLAREQLRSMGRKALIVTDGMMVQLGNVSQVEKALESENVEYTVFDKINGEPTDQMIEEGLEAYRTGDCDFLVALGGGSPIDAMKAIAALCANGGTISDYMGKVITGVLPRMAAIPTTAGTGSEATQFTIITDTKKDIKMLLKGQVLMPDLAIIDPQFTLTAPAKITAATGLDALTHAVEAYTSKKAQSLSDTFALSAVERIFNYLPIAFREGNNTQAREQMSIAALEAGIAFNNASVTVVHGMSRPIGALFHVPHGLSNAMLLKECLNFVLDGAYDRFAKLGRVIQVAAPEDSDECASKKFLQAVEELCSQLETPNPAEYGIDKDSFMGLVDKMSTDAMASGSPQNTRKELTKQDLEQIYQRLWK